MHQQRRTVERDQRHDQCDQEPEIGRQRRDVEPQSGVQQGVEERRQRHEQRDRNRAARQPGQHPAETAERPAAEPARDLVEVALHGVVEQLAREGHEEHEQHGQDGAAADRHRVGAHVADQRHRAGEEARPARLDRSGRRR
jgi:hypothetical protein